MKNPGHIACFLGSMLLASACGWGQNIRTPNIILIVASELGYGDLGCYGQQKISTPNIDAMAAEGLRFTQFYSASCLGTASRASLLTGLHSGHAPIRGIRDVKPEGQYPLPKLTNTLPHMLRQQGYATAVFGKWGLGGPGSTGTPDKQGFMEFFGYLCDTEAHNYYPDHLWHNQKRVEWPFNRRKDSVYSADYIHQVALAYLAKAGRRPFFLYLPYTLPHGNLNVPGDSVYVRYVKQFYEWPASRPRYLPPGLRYEPFPHAAYAAMVTRLDRYVGEIRKLLAAKGLSKSTLIIFTSDNGAHREDDADPEFFNSTGGLSGVRRSLFEGAIRIPAIACWPGVTKPGVSDIPAALYDLYPTICNLAGVAELPAGIDGLSLAPTLKGKGEQRLHEFLYWEMRQIGSWQALRKGAWKLITLNISGDYDPIIKLYNLADDPAESNDLKGEHRKLVAEMMKLMLRQHKYHGDWPL